jgi:hypothetical protein
VPTPPVNTVIDAASEELAIVRQILRTLVSDRERRSTYAKR